MKSKALYDYLLKISDSDKVRWDNIDSIMREDLVPDYVLNNPYIEEDLNDKFLVWFNKSKTLISELIKILKTRLCESDLIGLLDYVAHKIDKASLTYNQSSCNMSLKHHMIWALFSSPQAAEELFLYHEKNYFKWSYKVDKKRAILNSILNKIRLFILDEETITKLSVCKQNILASIKKNFKVVDCTCPECFDSKIPYTTFLSDDQFLFHTSYSDVFYVNITKNPGKVFKASKENFHRMMIGDSLESEEVKNSVIGWGDNKFSFDFVNHSSLKMSVDEFVDLGVRSAVKLDLNMPDLSWDEKQWVKSRVFRKTDKGVIFEEIREDIPYTFVSHIWELPDNPDPLKQVFYCSLVRYGWVWLDYISLPQKIYHEEKFFSEHLSHIFKGELHSMYSIQKAAKKSVKILPSWGIDEYNHRGWCVAEQSLIGSSPMLDLLYKYYTRTNDFKKSLSILRIHLSDMGDADAIKGYFGLKGGMFDTLVTIKDSSYSVVEGYLNKKQISTLNHMLSHRKVPKEFLLEMCYGSTIKLINLDNGEVLYNGKWLVTLFDRKEVYKTKIHAHYESIQKFYKKHNLKLTKRPLELRKGAILKNLIKGCDKGWFESYLDKDIKDIPSNVLKHLCWTRIFHCYIRVNRGFYIEL